MKENPYCPVCKYGLIIYDDDDDYSEFEMCEWICLLEEREKCSNMKDIS